MNENQTNLLRQVVQPDTNTMLCHRDGTGKYKYVAGPDSTNLICIMTEKGLDLMQINYLRILPLCWIDNKPVYKGDILAYVHDTAELFHIIVEGHNSRLAVPEKGLEGTVVTVFDDDYALGNSTWAHIGFWKWPAPPVIPAPVKVEAWFDPYDELRMLKAGSKPLSKHWVRAPEFDPVAAK